MSEIVIDQRTPHLGLPLPHPENDGADDVLRLREALLEADAALHALGQLLATIGQTAGDALPATGTAVAATRLATARLINGVPFDGTADIRIHVGEFAPVSVVEDAAIAAFDFAQIANAAASVTVTLPAEPEAGQLVMVGNFTDRRDHRIAVGSAPVKGLDVGGYVLLDKARFTLTLKFISAEYGWEIM